VPVVSAQTLSPLLLLQVLLPSQALQAQLLLLL
jgi:hypothetical protein